MSTTVQNAMRNLVELPQLVLLSILAACDAESRDALEKAHGHFSVLLNSCGAQLCSLARVQKPSKRVMAEVGIPDCRPLLDHNPLGRDVFPLAKVVEETRFQRAKLLKDVGNVTLISPTADHADYDGWVYGNAGMFQSVSSVTIDLNLMEDAGVPLWLIRNSSVRVELTIRCLLNQHTYFDSVLIHGYVSTHGQEYEHMIFLSEVAETLQNETIRNEFPHALGIFGVPGTFNGRRTERKFTATIPADATNIEMRLRFTINFQNCTFFSKPIIRVVCAE